MKEKGIKPIKIDDYPAIKKHLDGYYSLLEKRTDKGDTPYNLRNCAYIEDFSMQKIVYPNMTSFLPFYLDNKGFVQNDKSFMITGKCLSYLTCFLNSSLFKFCYIENFPALGEKGRELRKIFFDKIAVKLIDNKTDLMFEKLILNIQKIKEEDKDTRLFEIEIDNLIFDIHQITIEEREIIGFIDLK